MKVISLIFFMLFLLSCKEKVPPKVVQIPKIEITKEGKIIPIDSTLIAQIKDSSVLAFYHTNQNKTFWLANSNRENVVALLQDVQDEGLFPRDFDLKNIQTSEKLFDSLTDSKLVDYDILLTENLSRFVQKVSKGSLNPNKLYPNWELKENKINLKTILLNFQKKDSFDYAVNSASPNHIVYKRLKTALKIVNALPKYNLKNTELKLKLF